MQPLISLRNSSSFNDEKENTNVQYELGPELSVKINECIELQEELSRGGFAVVYKASMKQNNEVKTVAVKKLIKQRAHNERDRKRLINEM